MVVSSLSSNSSPCTVICVTICAYVGRSLRNLAARKRSCSTHQEARSGSARITRSTRAEPLRKHKSQFPKAGSSFGSRRSNGCLRQKARTSSAVTLASAKGIAMSRVGSERRRATRRGSSARNPMTEVKSSCSSEAMYFRIGITFRSEVQNRVIGFGRYFRLAMSSANGCPSRLAVSAVTTANPPGRYSNHVTGHQCSSTASKNSYVAECSRPVFANTT